MARSATAGEMSTRITVKTLTPGDNENGVQTETWAAVFTGQVRCKWVNAHGQEAMENRRLELGETATLTMRYTALIDNRCRVWRENDAPTQADPTANSWEVNSINDVEDKHQFLEMRVSRRVIA